MTIKLELLSKHRTKLMGIATLGILSIHSIDFGIVYPRMIRYVMHLGLYGVDIFLLLSGMGLYYSLKKNNDIRSFYIKRMRKVLVPYLIMAIPFFAIIDLLSGRNLIQYISDVAMISFWTSGRGAWFVAMIIPLYIIFPFIYRITEQSKYSVFYVWGGIIIITYSSFLFDILASNEIGFIENFLFVYRRLSTFFVGWFIGILIKNGDQSLIKCNCMAIGSIAFLFWFISTKIKIPLLISNYSWFALGASCLISLVFEKIDKKYILLSHGFTFLGSVSLTMYLGNIFLISIFNLIFKEHLLKPIQYSLIIVMGVGFSVLLNHVLESKLIGFWRKNV